MKLTLDDRWGEWQYPLWQDARTYLELIKGDLCYKLRMMGILLAGPLIVSGEIIKSIINNVASIPEHKLSKKHFGLCYHAVSKSLAF